MLTGKQKRYLRKEAHQMDPLFQIGKNGLSEQFIIQVDEALEKRELFKITLLQNTDEELVEVANTLSDLLKAEIVQTIGRIVVLYRASKKEKNQKYSKQVQKIRKNLDN